MEKFIIHTVILVAIVGVIITLFFVIDMPDSKHPLVGTWEASEMITEHPDGSRDREFVSGTIEFNEDGTGSYVGKPFTWEDIGDNQIRTRDEEGVMVYDYLIQNDVLRLTVRDPGGTITIVFYRV